VELARLPKRIAGALESCQFRRQDLASLHPTNNDSDTGLPPHTRRLIKPSSQARTAGVWFGVSSQSVDCHGVLLNCRMEGVK
jgi:hypothetical protein